ncbi:MAG: phage holin family protein [Oscillospiraceae bacterium]|nr:phage holin family protein [Oscillospiraceae bacterium]
MTLEHIWEAIIAVLVATVGGIVRLLNVKNLKALKMIRVVAAMLTAAFTGGIIFLISQPLHIDPYWACALSGLAGWGGTRALTALTTVAIKATGVDIKGEDKKDE